MFVCDFYAEVIRNEFIAHFCRTTLCIAQSMLSRSLLLLVCVSFTIIGQPRNSVLIRRVSRSVCLSRSCIVSKRVNKSSNFFHYLLPPQF